MLEPPSDKRLHLTPLPNTKWPFTCHFVIFTVVLLREIWIFGGTTEIMKEIIGRGLGL
jgi:hypothetical protein